MQSILVAEKFGVKSDYLAQDPIFFGVEGGVYMDWHFVHDRR